MPNTVTTPDYAMHEMEPDINRVLRVYLGSIGYVPNRWITGPFEQHRSGNIVRAAYQALQA